MAHQFLFEPFRFGVQGGLSVTDDPDRHLRDKIVAVLFTAPGERLDNPQFGVGLNRQVFDPLDQLSAAALEYRIAEGLRRDVGDEIVLSSVDVEARPESGELLLNIGYSRRSDRIPRNLEIVL